MIRWFLDRLRDDGDDTHVSSAWTADQRRVDARQGWDGPVWRTPRNRAPYWDQKPNRRALRVVNAR